MNTKDFIKMLCIRGQKVLHLKKRAYPVQRAPALCGVKWIFISKRHTKKDSSWCPYEDEKQYPSEL